MFTEDNYKKEEFVAEFQKYLFNYPGLPTNVEIEDWFLKTKNKLLPPEQKSEVVE